MYKLLLLLSKGSVGSTKREKARSVTGESWSLLLHFSCLRVTGDKAGHVGNLPDKSPKAAVVTLLTR